MYYLYPTLCIILMYNMIQAENILHFIFVIVLHKHCRTSLGSWIIYPHLLIPKSWYQTFIKPNVNLNPRTTMTKYYLIRWWIFSTSQLHKGSTSMFRCCDVVVKGHLFKLSSTTQKCGSSAEGKLLTGPREMTYNTDICCVQHSVLLNITSTIYIKVTCMYNTTQYNS